MNLRGPAPSKFGSTQNMAATIKVAVRLRPMNEKETELNHRSVIEVVDDKMLVFDPKEEMRLTFYHGVQQPNRNYLKRANKELKFVFDNVCDQNASNKDIFEITTKDMVTSLMEGYNCSVFAYGATGAGKTFTMIGNRDHPGITYLTMEHLFATIKSFEKDRVFDIGVSYLEVYNENVFDLLKPLNKPLQLREDVKFGVVIVGLTLNKIKTARELFNMLEDGNKNRTQHPTDANAESSRSHAVFQVYIKMQYKTSSQLRFVKLSMIDLAGSERASATGCVGERFKEGANINRSLLSLGNCINMLADGNSYIPYRDSKLTRLLKDSLGGNCKTVMIANISPSSLSYDDTYNTLKYAARASKIQLSVKKNIVDGDMRCSQYVKFIDELKKKVKELEAKLSLASFKPANKEREAEKEKLKQEWRRRIIQEAEQHGKLEDRLLALMCRQRILAFRRRLRNKAFQHVADLAHRSSCEAMEQVRTEEIPRQERAVESCVKQAVLLDTKIEKTWTIWQESSQKLNSTYNQALIECPGLVDLIEKLQTESSERRLSAKANLRYKLLLLEREDQTVFTDYMNDATTMLRDLYLILKGYDKVTPSITTKYLDIMKKVKSAKGITWSDTDPEIDSNLRFIYNLDMDKPSKPNDFDIETDNIDITDSDELTDIENIEPVRAKRKGTPIKLINKETIIINDSIESLDVTRNLISAKKVKREVIGCDDPNSTFVLADKKLPVKLENMKKENVPVRRGLFDGANVQRNINFGDRGRTLKPLVGRAQVFRRPPTTAAAPPARPAGAFGSTLSRDGTPLQTNVQVRSRQRPQTHPYMRP